MRFRSILICFACLCPLWLEANASNPPTGFTGGFGERTCLECHAGTLNSGTGNVAVSAPKVYAGGTRYTLQVVVNDPGAIGWGFELSARFTNGGQAGSFPSAVADQSVRTSTSNGFQIQYVAQASSIVQVGRNVIFDVPWMAPPDAAGGDVVFNVIGVAANHDGGTGGDRTYRAEIRSLAGFPTINANGIVNAADFQPAVAPGSLVSIFGKFFMSGDPAQPSTLPLPTNFGGVIVGVAGVSCPLLYISPTQINLQIPFSSPSVATVFISSNSAASASVNLQIAQYAPAIFTTGTTAGGTATGAVLHADYSAVSVNKPAFPGETVLIFATGLGPVVPSVTSGAAAPAFTNTTSPATVTMGGTAAFVSYSGLAPGFAGLYQINATVPPVSGIVEVLVTVGAVTSRPGVTIQTR